MSPRLICLYLLVHLRTQTCGGFNIDDRFPVIKEGKTKGSFFGFSVAMHHQTTGPGATRYLLLTGAPKEKAQSLKNVNETGAVYSCPITLDTADCSRMDLVTQTNPREMVEGMWLGVTVASQRDLQDGRVLACGHRYVKITQSGSEEQRRMVGKCYVRSNDLTFDPDDNWQSYSDEVCNPNFDVEFEGMCNAGISAGMTDTDIYIGSAGSYSWQGNVHVIWTNPVNIWDRADYDFGVISNNRQRYKFSYMGYSVLEEKKLLSRDEYTVVTGSPRNESKGSVVLGSAHIRSKIQLVVNIPGEQVGSYFGNSLAVTDLNNDDWNDLIVGAPFYFDRVKDQGGAVYVFMNENGSFQEKATVVLKGPPDSAFGMAVAAIGDINQDGFQDFAVGAPFHGTGKVYIWMGSKKGISMEPSQVIEGKSVGSGFKTFGYSINGGMDMDDNSYPDILVGSLDDRIALLRARPVVHLTSDFTVEPKIVDPNLCSGNKSCITVTLCMSFTLSNGNKDFKSIITVKFTVEADAGRRKSHRVHFLSSKADTYTGLLSLQSSKTTCDTLELGVMGAVKDKLEPVLFSLNVSLHHQNLTRGDPKPMNLDFFPILSLGQKLTHRTEINFLNECGSDNKCSSNLQLQAWFANDGEKRYPSQGEFQVLQLSSAVKIIKLMVNVTNYPSDGKLAEDAHQAMLNVKIPDALKYSGVRYKDHSVECSFDTTVICDLGNPLKGKDNVSFEINFETSGIDLYTQKIECQLLLSTLSEQSDLKPVPVTLLIENTITPIFSTVKEVVYTRFSGTVMGESAMNHTSDVGSLVEFNFMVDTNKQPLGDLGTLAVEIEWPYEVANGKWLLYLTKVVVKGESEMECNPGGVVNSLNLSERRPQRRKRQTAGDESNDGPHVQTAAIKFLPQRKTYHLECSAGTARCVTFTCPLINMTNSATINVRSRLWNGTMLEDYSNALRVIIKGKATLKLIENKPSIKMDDQTITFTVETEPVEGVETPYELPLWIIVSAVVAGVVLLGIIILILWKLGFFKRASYYRIMPKHRGVKICKAERYDFNVGFQPEEPLKKCWITNWTEMQHYCY